MPTSKEIIKAIEAAGWREVRISGSHTTFKHPQNPSLVTIVHPRKDNPKGYVRKIEKTTGVKLL